MNTIETDFNKVNKILNDNKVSYKIYKDIDQLSEVINIMLIRLYSENKESTLQILFNENNNIISIEIINGKYESYITAYNYLIDDGNIELIESIKGEDILYSKYIDDILDIIYKPKRKAFEFTDRLELQTNKGFENYIDEDNIQYKKINIESSNTNIYIAFNRYDITTEIVYTNDKLDEIIILSSDILNRKTANLREYTGKNDIPCMIISSLINYILKE